MECSCGEMMEIIKSHNDGNAIRITWRCIRCKAVVLEEIVK